MIMKGIITPRLLDFLLVRMGVMTIKGTMAGAEGAAMATMEIMVTGAMGNVEVMNGVIGILVEVSTRNSYINNEALDHTQGLHL